MPLSSLVVDVSDGRDSHSDPYYDEVELTNSFSRHDKYYKIYADELS